DTKTEKYVTRRTGLVGMTDSAKTSAPNGVLIVEHELWVSEGDIAIKIFDLSSGRLKSVIQICCYARAKVMSYVPKGKIVIVANSNDDPPFLTLITTDQYHLPLGRVTLSDSEENIERSAYHAPSGTFFTAVPVSRADKTKGLLAQTAQNGV